MGEEELDLGILSHVIQTSQKAVQWNAMSQEAWEFGVSEISVQNSYQLIRFTQRA